MTKEEPDFTFKKVDHEGMEVLDVVSNADKFNHWMYQSIRPYCKGNILEIGSGIGNISEFFFKDNYHITLSDVRENYCERLKSTFGEEKTLAGVMLMDLTSADFDEKFKNQLGTFDTVFALNVVEHIKDHQLALANCYKLLKPGGHVVILVPAYQWLYNQFDKELEHYRRYTKKQLSKLMVTQGFEVIKSTYFNFMGIWGWWISGKLQRNKTIPEGQMKLYNKLVPVFKVIDRCVFKSAGLSTIAIGKKN